MRISLIEGERKEQGRRWRGRRSRSRTFGTALDWPVVQRRRQPVKRRARAKRSRARSRPQTRQAKAQARSRSVKIPWRSVVRRLPVVLILAALIGVVAYAAMDARFFVYQYRVQIRGAHHVKAESIYQAAGVDEQHILWIQPQQVAHRIVQLDGIKVARVRCELPAQVFIEVEEREPVVMWRAETQGKDWWLDEDGVVLPYHGVMSDTIFVVDSSERHLRVGDHIEPQGIVRSVRQLAASLPGVRVFYYQVDRGLSFTQHMDGGEWPVFVGNGEDLSHKIQVLQALTDYLATHNIQPRYVDVRWAEHPVYAKAIP